MKTKEKEKGDITRKFVSFLSCPKFMASIYGVTSLVLIRFAQ